MNLRFIELFAGAGGLSLGLERAGWKCVAHAEIADAPRAILRHRWPDTPLYGDVTTLDGRALVAAHGPIDLLTGGSPCQDLSVAGKRAGLAGARSGLFYEQMRLWEETGADLCLWENVDGARSSNNGRDFGEVLRAFVGAPIPVPTDGWRTAGVAAGPTGVAAWRVLDAQFFGVPQRRRRIFVLGTRTGRVDPAEVLSLAEGVYGDFAARGEAGEIATAGTESGAAITFVLGSDPISRVGGASQPVTGRHGDPGCVLAFDQHNQIAGEVTPSIRTNGQNSGAPVVCFTGEITDAADAALDLRRGADHDGHSRRADNLSLGPDATHCVTGSITHALAHEGHDTSEDGTGRGTPIVARMVSFGEYVEDGTASAIKARDFKDATDLILDSPNVANSLRHKTHPTSAAGEEEIMVSAGIPRRLTPRECERLMSWPDDHTLVPDAKGKLLSDAARYKAAGNGVASVHSHWIGWRLALALETR